MKRKHLEKSNKKNSKACRKENGEPRHEEESRVIEFANPFSETPVLYDEDAYRFEMAAHNVKPLPKATQRRLQRAYKKFKIIADFE